MFEYGLSLKDTLSKPTIRSIFKNEFSQIGFSVVKVLVVRFMNSFGFSTKLTEDQLETITVDTLENFAYESLEDVILFFKMARSGKFGETNRGVDSNLIFGKWYPLYLEQKSREREKVYSDRKQKTKDSISVSFEDVKITYKKTIENRLKENVNAFVLKYTKNMDRQILEDTINHWEKDEVLKKYIPILKQQRRVIKK